MILHLEIPFEGTRLVARLRYLVLRALVRLAGALVDERVALAVAHAGLGLITAHEDNVIPEGAD